MQELSSRARSRWFGHTQVMEWHERLAKEMKERGLTPAELSRMTKGTVSASLIGKYRAGHVEHTPNIKRLADALQLHVDWLRTGLGPKSTVVNDSLGTEEPSSPGTGGDQPGRSDEMEEDRRKLWAFVMGLDRRLSILEQAEPEELHRRPRKGPRTKQS